MIQVIPIAAFLIFTAWAACAFEAVDHVVYFGTTDQEITVSWDHNEPHPDRYEVRLFHVERKTNEQAGIGGTAGNNLTFRLPRSGHFVVTVRACMDSVTAVPDCDAPPCCSEWSESTDPAVAAVNGDPRGWWIYGYVAPPGDIVRNAGQNKKDFKNVKNKKFNCFFSGE